MTRRRRRRAMRNSSSNLGQVPVRRSKAFRRRRPRNNGVRNSGAITSKVPASQRRPRAAGNVSNVEVERLIVGLMTGVGVGVRVGVSAIGLTLDVAELVD